MLLAKALSFMSALLHNLRNQETSFMCRLKFFLHNTAHATVMLCSSNTKGTANEKHGETFTSSFTSNAESFGVQFAQ